MRSLLHEALYQSASANNDGLRPHMGSTTVDSRHAPFLRERRLGPMVPLPGDTCAHPALAATAAIRVTGTGGLWTECGWRRRARAIRADRCVR